MRLWGGAVHSGSNVCGIARRHVHLVGLACDV